MANKALLVGINAYPGCPLRGCVNDILNMADYLVKEQGFSPDEIRMLTDARATTQEIMDRLTWLVSDLKEGDKIVFHYSGHGAQAATRNPQEELDGLDEVICPVDFDWSDEHMIRDKQLNQLFKRVPAGVHFAWISDSCHSGDLSRELAPPKKDKSKKAKEILPRAFPTPVCIAWRNNGARHKKFVPQRLGDPALNVGFISGCKDNQTSADTAFNNKPCGALTHYLLETLTGKGKGKPLTEVVKLVNKALASNGYDQRPQAEGAKAGLPFLA